METRLGIILLENPFLSASEIERCLQIQELGGNKKPIGQVLVEQGVISNESLEMVLSIQRQRRAISAQRPGFDKFQDQELPDIGVFFERARGGLANDLILSSGTVPWIRCGGRLRALSNQVIVRPWMEEYMSRILTREERLLVDAGEMLVATLNSEHAGNSRIIAFQDTGGPSVTIRLFPDDIPPLSDLGHGPEIESCLDAKKGLVLVAGGSCSGKSTTLASMVEQIAAKGSKHILMIDEHQELHPVPGRCVVSRKRIGTGPEELIKVLRAARREDADVIVIGNLHGGEALEQVLQFVSTGHLVIAGVKSSGSIRALRWLMSDYSAAEATQVRAKFAASLLCVIYQVLMPNKNQSKLVLASEVLMPTREIRKAIFAGRFDRLPVMLTVSESQGCLALDASLFRLFAANTIAIDQAFTNAFDKQRFLAATNRS